MSSVDLREPVPAELPTTEFTLRPITADDAAMDHAALMETRDHLRLWEQSSWPEDDFTIEANRADLADLADLEARHAAGRAYTYTVLDPLGTECLGCVYVFPTSATFLTKATVTPLSGDSWADVQAVVYFWVRQSRMQTGLDGRLLSALRAWFTENWHLERTVYVTNEQFTQQVDLIERTDLTRRFELIEPDKAGTYLAYG